MKEKIKEEEKEMEKFSFWKTFLMFFLIILILSSIIFGFIGLYEEDIIDGLVGLIMLVSVLSMVLTFVVKWLKDYKRTGRWFILIEGRAKPWQIIGLSLLLMLTACNAFGAFLCLEEKDESAPIQINPSEWNPDGYYG